MTRVVLAVLVLVSVVVPSGPRAEVYGVVAGADAYQHVPKLGGAVRDAEDVAGQLEWLGAKVRVLLDENLSRDTLTEALQEALQASGPDDVIVFSFAGHGLQIADQDGDESDGYDETFVLPNYRPGIRDSENLIFDDEIDAFVRQAAPRTVVFVADSCHSGTMLRAVDPRANFRAIRSLPRSSFGDGPPAGPRPAGRDLREPSDNLLFVGAVPEHLVVQEVLIDGEPRGALSYAVARALHGNGDRDRNGVLTTEEVSAQVVEMVRAVSEARQTPEVHAGVAVGKRLFQLPEVTEAAPSAPASAPTLAAAPGSTAAPAPAASPAPATSFPAPAAGPSPGAAGLEPLRIAALGSDAAAPALWQLEGVEVVAAAEQADLIFDPASGDLLTQQGDRAAELGPARGRDLLQAIVDKWRLLAALDRVIDGSVEARVLPDDRLYRAGDWFEVRITARQPGRLVMFDLASDGSLIQLLPGAGRPAPAVAAGDVRLESFQAGPPFGADHLVIAIAPEAALDPVVDLLGRVHGRPLSGGEADRLSRMMAGWGAVPLPLYTAP